METDQHQGAKGSATRRLPNPAVSREDLLRIIGEVRERESCAPRDVDHILRRHRGAGGAPLSRSQLLAAYRELCAGGVLPLEREMLRRLQRKPVRTLSGVAPVTVLTEPFPCPGRCVFCPDREGMPKSYLPDEPGAMRGAAHGFDPHAQTAGRLRVLTAIGHSTDKVELLILGATWSAYPHDYQEWFVRRCLDALNGSESASLLAAQRCNETAVHRNVGLVIETRPDTITPEEVRRLRWLGVTKVQLGIQSLDDSILEQNWRGHTVEQTREAIRRLRLAGFKIALHWMPNLLGATPSSDLVDFRRLWDDPALRPDELKIYPCLLLPDTHLHTLWQQGLYQPYSEDTLVELLVQCKQTIPRYCRVNRLMRDIPAPNIVEGVTKSNLRQIVQRRMAELHLACSCIRCREVRRVEVDPDDLRLDRLDYATDVNEEHFLSYVTPEDKLAGFLRLSLPVGGTESPIEEIRGCAMIREVHVYGPALDIDADSEGEAQHVGVGSRLIQEASRLARQQGFDSLAVIAAVGTREYYRKHGFAMRGTYMVRCDNDLPLGG
jgi:elongator complex protein 3